MRAYRLAPDRNSGGLGNDVLLGSSGNDRLFGELGNDFINGGVGNDIATINIDVDGADRVDLADGDDEVEVTSFISSQVRLTFTSTEVGNGSSKDSNTLANQDGNFAVRMQREDLAGNLVGDIGRLDDEGITFKASLGLKFDVQDLVTGAQRGDMFDEVQLGTKANEILSADSNLDYYINAGMGDDTVTGAGGRDFLVGGAGNDKLDGGLGDDSFIGGGGNDKIAGGLGDDTAIVNVSTDGEDLVDLGDGKDNVIVNATAPTQIRLTFTSAEVGNGNVNDAGTMTNQDGGLAVRMQAENGAGNLIGTIGRYEDEGINFEAGTGVTFDVRDLVSGVARGDKFQEVSLGSGGADKLGVDDPSRAYYLNAGMGDDTIVAGNSNDFLVGGAGNETLRGGKGQDSFISGGGNDKLSGGTGIDAFIFAAPLDASSNVDVITDFLAGVDVVRLDDAVFSGLPVGALAAEAFQLASAASEADDRIIYNQTTGELLFDSNGGDRGNAILFATLQNKPATLDNGDFIVI